MVYFLSLYAVVIKLTEVKNTIFKKIHKMHQHYLDIKKIREKLK